MNTKLNMYKAFHHFSKEVRLSQRFIWSETTSEFLLDVSTCLQVRVKNFVKSSLLYRSQIGYESFEDEGEEEIRGLQKERMKPKPEFAIEGRANPKGIPYLYLATDKETSMSELRPHVGQFVSCGIFEISKDLNLIDCHSTDETLNKIKLILYPPTNPQDIINATWYEINKAFSKPVQNNESDTNYVPTQILAELIKSKGYDGLYCKSHLGPGYNVILFEFFK